MIGEDSEFWDEDAEDYVLPVEMDEYDIVQIVDGYVYVNNLVPTGYGRPEYKFSLYIDWPGFTDLFKSEAPQWCNDATKDKILDAIKRAKSWEGRP